MPGDETICAPIFTHDEYQAFQISKDILAGLSIISSLFVMFNFLSFKDLRTYCLKLVFWMCLCNIIATSGVLIVEHDYGPICKNNWQCKLQGCLITFGVNGFVFWNMAIAHAVYNIMQSKSKSDVEKMYYRYHYVIWPLLIILTGLPWIHDTYGWAGAWCWIKPIPHTKSFEFVWRLITFYIPAWIALIYSSYRFYQVSKFMSSESNKYLHRLKWFSIVFILSFIPGTIQRTAEFIPSVRHHIEANYPLWYVVLTFSHPHALFIAACINCFIFGWTASLSSKYQEYFKCLCCSKNASINESEENNGSLLSNSYIYSPSSNDQKKIYAANQKLP